VAISPENVVVWYPVLEHFWHPTSPDARQVEQSTLPFLLQGSQSTSPEPVQVKHIPERPR
jgi:hypothetical protein